MHHLNKPWVEQGCLVRIDGSSSVHTARFSILKATEQYASACTQVQGFYQWSTSTSGAASIWCYSGCLRSEDEFNSHTDLASVTPEKFQAFLHAEGYAYEF